MKNSVFIFFIFLNFTHLFGQPDVSTSGDNSPAVIAENLSVTYGVRADAIEAILWIYEAEGYDVKRRNRATEQILREYGQSPEKEQKTDELSEDTRQKMGIADSSKITSALEWDLFASNHYLSTTGYNSPAVIAKGDVNIWYGISPKALRALATQLEKSKSDLTNFETQLGEQVKKYEDLKTELETYGSQEEIYRQAEALLEAGKLEEAEQLIQDDFDASMKRQAYKGYIYGKTKALLLKYEEAAKGYLNAVQNDSGNSTYHLYYANNQTTLAQYEDAIEHYEIAISIDSLKSGNEERIAALVNNLGGVWEAKGEYDKAIEYYEEALRLDLSIFSENHPKVAIEYNNLGTAWKAKGEYDIAIGYHEKALEIDSETFGENHPNVATRFNNLGSAWEAKGEYDKAIEYYEEALRIDLDIFSENHPKVAIKYNNLGTAWKAKGEYDIAIDYYEKALKIDLYFFSENHPLVATKYNNLGTAWEAKGGYDKAIEYFEKALQIILYIFDENHPHAGATYNNLGTAWKAKREYDIAIEYYEKALQIDLRFFSENHPKLATRYSNLGFAWGAKGDYDKAIEYYEKALVIDLKVFGDSHKYIRNGYYNLGFAWQKKQEHDKAIEYYEKVLQIDLQTLGEIDPIIATDFNNLGLAWGAKGNYDKAIEYYEKSLAILGHFFEPIHPYQKTSARNLSRVSNRRGRELSIEKRYMEALPYYEKALENADAGGDVAFSITCLNNIGSTFKHLKDYEQGLLNLELGIQKAAELNQEIDKQIKEQLIPEKADDLKERRKLSTIRRMKYHKVGCLKGLKRNKKAKALAKQLWLEGVEANDSRLLEDLRKEGYDFEK